MHKHFPLDTRSRTPFHGDPLLAKRTTLPNTAVVFEVSGVDLPALLWFDKAIDAIEFIANWLELDEVPAQVALDLVAGCSFTFRSLVSDLTVKPI